MARVKWGRWAVDFLRIVNGGEAPHRGAGMPPAAGKQVCEMEAPSGFALPGVPSGDGGAGGRRGEPTDTETAGQRHQQARAGAGAQTGPGAQGDPSAANGRASPGPGASRPRSPKGGPRGDPAGPRAGDSRPGAQEGRPNREPAPERMGRPSQTRPARADGARTRARGRAGEPGGTARGRGRRAKRGRKRRTGPAKRRRARRAGADPRRGRGPGARGDAESAKKPPKGAGAHTTLWSAGNLPAREQPGRVGAKLPPGPDPEPSRQRSGSRWGHGLAWCNPVRRSLRAWCALQSLRRSRPCMPLENLP